jgi:hypothetical protein
MRIGYGVVIAAVGLVLLAGCSPEPADDRETEQPVAEPTPSATTSTPVPAAPVFELPAECVEIVTAETLGAFEAAGVPRRR